MSAPYPDQLLIGGQLRPGRGAERAVVNPATEQVLTTVRDAGEADVQDALDAARRASADWGEATPNERAAVLRAIGAAVTAGRDRLTAILVDEVGKPVTEAEGEIATTARFFTFTASLLEVQADEIRYTDRRNEEIWTRRRPYGVVAAIIPWNFPAALVSRKVAPAIGAGNAVVLKADEKTPLSALAIGEILAGLPGLPSGLVSILTGPGETIGRALVTSPLTHLVSMTGSSEAGKAILADAARSVKPVSLELGGKAPFIVLPDADLPAAVSDAVVSRYMNCGQVCIANERTYVHEDVYEAFVEQYAERVSALVVGDPRERTSEIGPKISAAELAKTLQGVRASAEAGARVLVGGGKLAGGGYDRGYWMQPTVLTEVTDAMPAMTDELFGPVTPITSFRSWPEVRDRANATRYGLSAYVYTDDLDSAMRASRELSFGEVYINRVGPEEINGFHVGYRESGLGGDDGPHGLDLYSRRQTVYLRSRAARR
jgi:lactaldehyde dehydrogenase/glycolaldehyde dehydrogenase